ncbi:phosphoribosylformylglycinamidine synthase I [Pirellulales bacterium]|nr:phosphoribosylformylglycinamidine synthase I [Pirellulales bacterium]
MPQPRVLVVRAPGTNCDAETRYAFQLAGARANVLHLNRWLESPTLLRDVEILCVPGGFSYGDDIAAGRIFANQLRCQLGDEIRRFRDDGGLVLGICNGFQVLLKSGLLDEHAATSPMATLAWNRSGRYVDRWVRLAVDAGQCVFLAGIETIALPIAHAEGNFQTVDDSAFERLEQAGRFPLRYCPADDSDADYNPNGAQGNVAGMCDATGQVLGLMPHPERFIDPRQHPSWTREPTAEEGAGLQLFRNAVAHFS